jgi:NAD-dependent deacetylase
MNNLTVVAKEFVRLTLSSSNAIALTGAGISTESGIPDYRSPGTGLWDRIDHSVVSLEGFLEDPTRYYSYSRELYPMRRSAKPNPAHYLLAELEQKGFLKGVITQNVDGLHQDAGSKNVYELHGSLRQAICLECSSLYAMDEVMERAGNGENPPLCKECEGILKPNAVFFGELLPQSPWAESLKLTREADLLLVMGSSLQVSPANMLPDIALRAGARLAIINLAPTPYDTEAVLRVGHKVGEFSTLAYRILGQGMLNDA